jgi:hypothetical protein
MLLKSEGEKEKVMGNNDKDAMLKRTFLSVMGGVWEGDWSMEKGIENMGREVGSMGRGGEE